jgi:hypothetical protein
LLTNDDIGSKFIPEGHAGLAMEAEEMRSRKVSHRTAYRKPRSDNSASVDRLQSLVAGLAGINQMDLKPYLKSGLAIKPDDPARSPDPRRNVREKIATKTVTTVTVD